MKWERVDANTIRSGDYTIRRGRYFIYETFRLWLGGRFLANCNTAESAKKMAEQGWK